MKKKRLYEKQVKAGIEFLDQIRPEWEDLIDIEVLDMKNCHCCILGQLYDHYWNATAELSFTNIRADELGFTLLIPFSSAITMFPVLTEEWKLQIQKKRKGGDA